MVGIGKSSFRKDEDYTRYASEDEEDSSKLSSWSESFSRVYSKIKDWVKLPGLRSRNTDVVEAEGKPVTARSDTFQFSFGGIATKIKELFNVLKQWGMSQVRKITGRYEEGTFEHDMVKTWGSFYEDFKSSETQDKLAKATDMHGKSRNTKGAAICDLVEEINSFVKDMQLQEVRYGRNTIVDGALRKVVFDMMTMIPKEAVRLCASEQRDVHALDVAITECSIMVDLLKYIKELRDTEGVHNDPFKLKDACETLGLIFVTFMVSNPKCTTSLERRKVTYDLLMNILCRNIAISDTTLDRNHSNKCVKEMGAFVENVRKKVKWALPITDNVFSKMCEKHGVPKDYGRYQATMIFICNMLAKSGIISYEGYSRRGSTYCDKELEDLCDVLRGNNSDTSLIDEIFTYNRNFAENFLGR